MEKSNVKKYFKVIAKCGHVGRKKYVPIQFAVVAENGKEASSKVRSFPRVKHDRKYAILLCRAISFDEFIKIRELNNSDEYLKCKNKQEQECIEGFKLRIVQEEEFSYRTKKHDSREERIIRKMNLNRIILKSLEVEVHEYCY